jgi:quercetin dioxygenase-like cupin family protein
MNLAKIESKEIMPGCHGKMVHGQKITWAFWNIEQGATVPKHHHHHEQMMYIMDGEFEFTLFGETNLYTAGDIVSIPSNEPHSGKALTPCRLMDVFSPVREEYR